MKRSSTEWRTEDTLEPFALFYLKRRRVKKKENLPIIFTIIPLKMGKSCDQDFHQKLKTPREQAQFKKIIHQGKMVKIDSVH